MNKLKALYYKLFFFNYNAQIDIFFIKCPIFFLYPVQKKKIRIIIDQKKK